ncbi:MAG: sigma-70 family RNA polymerase sigma factor [Bacteroidales bacterium]|nr:sigma-70 family RNA polymerase sigma factor [Bacteroidales bacterium]
MRHLTDQELVVRYRKGSQESIEVLINRHKNKVYSYILMTVKNTALAEDLFQDTFIKVVQSLDVGRYRENGRFLSWVIRIAHNLIIDYYRKQNKMNTYSNDDYENDLFNNQKLSDMTVEEKIVREQIYEDVRKLLEYLPEEQREVVVLRHYAGLSFKEIADHTNVSINTALGRMRYALINMRKMIEAKNLNLTLQ